MRLPASIALSAACVALAVAGPAGQARDQGRPGASLERTFAAGGEILMDLSAGEYTISGTSDGRIRVDWSVERDRQLSDVRADIDVDDEEARIRVDGSNNNFRATIQVPSRSDLRVRLTAGELKIEGIEGSKDVRLHAGEIDIDVGRADDYSRADVSIWAGEINAEPFGASRDGLFRSLDWDGEGPYDLRVRLKAGEVTLRGARASRD
jgi:hypothetical protein